MGKPTILSGKLVIGANVMFGENVVVNVAEELVIGDRCVIPDNARFEGRRITLGSDFYGYSWEWKRLDIGRGRIDEEDAILTVGARCTFHDNRIDLSRRVTVGADVGLSPEVVIYTHGYWLSLLEGYPYRYDSVTIGDGVIVGFRSTILPGAVIGRRAVIGAQSVVAGELLPEAVYAGCPARKVRDIHRHSKDVRTTLILELIQEYCQSCDYRRFGNHVQMDQYPIVRVGAATIDVEKCVTKGIEDELTDDFRDFLFKRGIRIYSTRPFRKLPRRS